MTNEVPFWDETRDAIVKTLFSELLTDPHIIFHAGAALSFVALAFKDQLKLRSVLVFSIILDLTYHLLDRNGPAWNEAFWNVVTFLINFKVLIEITLDRTHIGLSKEQEDLFAAFGALTPGQFRNLLRIGRWKTAEETTVITTEGLLPDHLYYVLHGGITLRKGKRKFATETRTFIGEVAFLHNVPASATVALEPGTRYIEWPVKALEKQLDRQQDLKNAVVSLIGLDMALKVARA